MPVHYSAQYTTFMDCRGMCSLFYFSTHCPIKYETKSKLFVQMIFGFVVLKRKADQVLGIKGVHSRNNRFWNSSYQQMLVLYRYLTAVVQGFCDKQQLKRNSVENMGIHFHILNE